MAKNDRKMEKVPFNKSSTKKLSKTNKLLKKL